MVAVNITPIVTVSPSKPGNTCIFGNFECKNDHNANSKAPWAVEKHGWRLTLEVVCEDSTSKILTST